MEEGLELMVYGMSGVFLFLILMVVVMTFTSVIVKKFEKPVSVTAGTDDQLAQVAVAIAAVKRHTQG